MRGPTGGSVLGSGPCGASGIGGGGPFVADASALAIVPTTRSLAPLGTQTFRANGGATPYVYTLSTNNSGGSINSSTGAYVAGITGSVADTVLVTDAQSKTASAVVTLSVAISIAPTSAALAASISQSFTGAGGSGGYVYTIPTNNSGATINASTGAYVSGTVSGTDTVRVTDSNGATADASVVVTAVFDPATLSLTGWWRAPYSASPWVGTASAGSSGSRNLTEATNPPSAGATLNGYAPASFDGVNDKLAGIAISNFFKTDGLAGSFVALLNPTTVAVTVNDDADPKVFGDSTSTMALVLNGIDPAGLLHYYGADGPVDTTVRVATSGSWVIIRGKWDGSKVYCARNHTAFDAGTTYAGLSALSGLLKVGCNYNASSFANLQLAELILADTVLTDGNFSDIIDYINARYALSL